MSFQNPLAHYWRTDRVENSQICFATKKAWIQSVQLSYVKKTKLFLNIFFLEYALHLLKYQILYICLTSFFIWKFSIYLFFFYFLINLFNFLLMYMPIKFSVYLFIYLTTHLFLNIFLVLYINLSDQLFPSI